MGGGGAEEGEIPVQQPPPPPQSNNNNNNNNNSSNNRRYYMRDLYKYTYPRASDIYNIAWASAVKNKPLLLDKSADVTDNNNNKQESDESGGVVGKEVVVESDKEEGELEEGEIDADFGEAGARGGTDSKENGGRGNNSITSAMEIDDGELEVQVSSIRKVLDNVTASDAIKSFDIVCARLRSSLESLRELVLHTWFPSKDDLIQQSFAAIICVHSVFCSMSPALRDQNRDKMSRLLTFVMSLSSVLFTPDQGKQVEAMITSVTPPPPPAPPKPKARERQEELPVTDNKAILTDSNTLSVNAGDNSSDILKRVGLESPLHQSDKQNTSSLSDAMKQFQANLKVRGGGFGPLLDLHKVHDEDSLPSPTSKTTPTLPFSESGAPPRIVRGLHNSAMHPYETEALKAVSSYQQKFGRSSFLTQDTLPSPTPSEDGNDAGADDLSEEVSSFTSYSNNNVKNANPSVSTQPSVSSAVATSMAAAQALVSGISTGPSSVGINSASRGPAKSRDPRLRHLSNNLGSVDVSFCPSPLVPNSAPKLEPLGEIMNPKKKPEGPVLDSPAPKRQRNGRETTYMSTNVSEVRTVPGSTVSDTNSFRGPQLVSRGFVGPTTDPRKLVGGAVTSGISNVNLSVPLSTNSQPVTNGGTTDPLQSLLKGIAGNPAAWISMFKEQQKFSEPLQNVPHSASLNLGQVSSSTTAPTISSWAGQTSAGSLQIPSQIAVTSPQEDSAKLRMKPRDPRRALQSNATQKTGNSVSEQRKVYASQNATNQGVQDNFNSQRHANGANTVSIAPPDIAKQFTKNLKNIADIITAPQTSSLQPPLPISSPQSAPVNLERASVSSGAPVNTADQFIGSVLKPEEAIGARPQSQNHWGDVEHLFEGYDAQQRAAIQQERARRMDEQKKMFDARKLCLVLDLDHTLLNSAKFTEVEARHDEILRKKEEHDREQPRRHLFRFPHMAMWTKLRPGIWNFLEKASKLYELHLYTMGNKLYATEMAKVLDPKGELFAGRVISRGDDGEPLDNEDNRVQKSKDLDGVLGMESSVVIIDDSVRVWPHNKLNLIAVERYLYFPCSRRQFGLGGASLLECDRDERPEDGTLACCLGVIEKIHQNFFANMSLDDVDVRNILASEQRKVLAGCRILFSRVIPVGEANPHLYALWQTAEQFGAVCTNQIDEQVTHVVANAAGTDKVNWALSTGRFAVYPGWVEASALLYRRANEPDFAIKPC